MAEAMPKQTERGLLVFAIWATLGAAGLCFTLEGLSRDALMLALAGTGAVVAAFVAHMIVNWVYGQGFTRGEATLGIGAYGLLALVFVLAWLSGGVDRAGYLAGLAFFGTLGFGFVAYLAARHGLRGTFSQFHVHGSATGEPK
ncbi:MAG: hypothetical protein P4L98_04155 [Ancalomicrobiaceae bacterium]|nr:hypothetical protein [Ancalomicrobiaceae bacterium]